MSSDRGSRCGAARSCRLSLTACVGRRYSRAVPEAEPLNVADYERLAAERLEPGVHGYFAGGAGDERTLRDNVAAFARRRLRPRVLVDVGVGERVATTVLGTEVSMPLLVAPVAFQRLVDPDGEVAMARAAAAAGTIMTPVDRRDRAPRGDRRRGAAGAALVPALLLHATAA